LRVSLPDRSLHSERQFDAKSEPTLAVSVIAGSIDIGPPKAPGYV
jgi:hypothetical protein